MVAQDDWCAAYAIWPYRRGRAGKATVFIIYEKRGVSDNE